MRFGMEQTLRRLLGAAAASHDFHSLVAAMGTIDVDALPAGLLTELTDALGLACARFGNSSPDLNSAHHYLCRVSRRNLELHPDDVFARLRVFAANMGYVSRLNAEAQYRTLVDFCTDDFMVGLQEYASTQWRPQVGYIHWAFANALSRNEDWERLIGFVDQTLPLWKDDTANAFTWSRPFGFETPGPLLSWRRGRI